MDDQENQKTSKIIPGETQIVPGGPKSVPGVSRISLWGSKVDPWGLQNQSLGCPARLLETFQRAPGSLEGPQSAPRGSQRSTWGSFWRNLRVIWGSFLHQKLMQNACDFLILNFMIFVSKKHGFRTLRTLDLKRPYGEFEGFSIFQKIASGINFGSIFE